MPAPQYPLLRSANGFGYNWLCVASRQASFCWYNRSPNSVGLQKSQYCPRYDPQSTAAQPRWSASRRSAACGLTAVCVSAQSKTGASET